MSFPLLPHQVLRRDYLEGMDAERYLVLEWLRSARSMYAEDAIDDPLMDPAYVAIDQLILEFEELCHHDR